MDKRNRSGLQKAPVGRFVKRMVGSCRISRTLSRDSLKSDTQPLLQDDEDLKKDLTEQIPPSSISRRHRCTNCPSCNATKLNFNAENRGTCSACGISIATPASTADESGSDYYPGTPSSMSCDSWSELMNADSDEELLSRQPSDVAFSSEDELSLYNPYHYQQTYGNGLKFQMDYFKRHSPVPTAGNDLPNTSTSSGGGNSMDCTPNSSPGSSPTPDSLSTMPAALRRVKSMVMDQQNDCVQTNKLSLCQVPAMRSHSPLISEQEQASMDLKVSPRSNINAKFSLRRSASNISVKMTPFKRGGVPLVKPCDRIEEGDEAESD